MKKTISFLLALLLMIPAAGAFADDSASLKEDGFSTSYTYNYDYWGDVQMSPDPYRVPGAMPLPISSRSGGWRNVWS